MSLPHLPAPWVILAQETAYHSRACAYMGARVEWKGTSRVYRSVPGQPFICKILDCLGASGGTDGTSCLPHWVVLNMGYLLTHPQAEDASQVLHRD